MTRAWLDGALVEDARLSVADRGLTLGDGLFETMAWRDGAIVRFGAHWARLGAAAAALALPIPCAAEAVAAGAGALTRALGLGQAALRLTLTRGEGPRGLAPPDPAAARLILTAAPLGPAPPPARLARVAVRRAPGAPTSRFKTLSYLDPVVALMQARALGADEAVVFDAYGRVSCAAAGNLFVTLADGRVVTPPLSCAALPGVTRAAILAAGAAREGVLRARDLAGAQAVALTNALVGVRPAQALDGRRLDPGHPSLEALFRAV